MNKFGFIYLLFYVAFNSQGHIAMGSLQVEETSAYCTVNHRASASNYQLSKMKGPARDSNPAASEVGGENSNRYTTEPPRINLEFNFFVNTNSILIYFQLKLSPKSAHVELDVFYGYGP